MLNFDSPKIDEYYIYLMFYSKLLSNATRISGPNYPFINFTSPSTEKELGQY